MSLKHAKEFIKELFVDTYPFGEVSIGFNRQLAKDRQDGIFHVRTPEGKVEVMPFRASVPGMLNDPDIVTVRGLFNQAIKVGFSPVSITLGGDTYLANEVL